ncbi:MAG: hypothetical protein HKN87_06295 [Saprospiraceae bacterium]|nr:hypothetical protein [Saprospiraceae bacterium]
MRNTTCHWSTLLPFSWKSLSNTLAGSGIPDVFSDSFKEAVDERCRNQVQPLRNNRNLIGYHFAHNAPANYLPKDGTAKPF